MSNTRKPITVYAEGKTLYVSQAVGALMCGISVSAFQKRNYAWEFKKGTYKYYDVAQFASESGDSTILDFNVERARLTKEQADKAEIENRRLRKELLDVSVVERWVSSMIQAARSRLLMMPRSMAPTLAAITDPVQIQDRLRNGINAALRELSSTVPGEIGEDSDEEVEAAAEADGE